MIERSPAIVLLTRDNPGDGVVEGTFAAGFQAIRFRAESDRAWVRSPPGVHDLPHGLVVEPQDEISAYLDVTHPEQLAADEDKVERRKRERR